MPAKTEILKEVYLMSKNEVGFAVTDEYKSWIDDIKKRIRQAQIKAAIKVNYELLDLYWELGKDIVKKQESAKWGDAFLKTMSKDLQKAFPDLSGLSPQNLKHIRYWYKFYSQEGIGLQAVTQLEDGLDDAPSRPALQEIEKLIKSIPWGHNQRIMYKCKSINEALFYVQKTMDNNWSRNVLEHQIDASLYERQGKAVTNFQVKLPEPQSDLAEQTLKDPYNFDFLSLREKYDEKELEDALVNQITQFLLELGTGFSYIGRQVPILVGKTEFRMDLLFYHVRLHCYVVVELKTEKFKPEFAGKLNFYVTVVNKNLKAEQDNQTIGILICKDKDDVVAEYALEDMSQPLGIAQYEFTKVLDKDFRSSLPTIEEIEQGLSE